MRFGLPAHAFVASLGLAGCALIAGLDDASDQPAGPADAAPGDRVVQADGMVTTLDGAPCSPVDLAEKSLVTIPRVVPSAPVVIDGITKEWACVARMAFLVGDRRVDLTNGRAVARVAVQYDDDALYVWASVTTAVPVGTAAANANFKNDSFHLFVMGPSATAEYTAEDHHIVIDGRGQVTDYSDVAGIRPTLEGIVGKASAPVVTADPALHTFEVELRVTAKTLGRTTFKTGDKLRVNFQINDGPPEGSKPGPAYRVWFLTTAACPTTASCSTLSTSEPYCNPRCTKELTLE